MEPLDVVEQIGPGLVTGSVVLVMHPLPLELPKESLAGGVAGTVSGRTRAAHQSVVIQEPLSVPADELPVLVRVQDDDGCSLSLPHRHLRRTDHHVAVLPVMHRPAHDQLAVQVNHHLEVQLAFLRVDLGDVGDPFGLGLLCIEVPLKQVLDANGLGPGLATEPASLPPRPALQARSGHQPGDAVAAGCCERIRPSDPAEPSPTLPRARPHRVSTSAKRRCTPDQLSLPSSAFAQDSDATRPSAIAMQGELAVPTLPLPVEFDLQAGCGGRPHDPGVSRASTVTTQPWSLKPSASPSVV